MMFALSKTQTNVMVTPLPHKVIFMKKKGGKTATL